MNLLTHMDLPITDPTWIFFLVLSIILLAPILLGKLRIPHIIVMILAGVILGEYGFNILERDSSFELFGKVGIFYIMLLAGLEMDMEDFKKNRTKAFIFGLFTFSVPMILGVWSSMTILGYGLITSVLLASMYASHTLISYPIINRYGLSRLRSVSITVGGTAITDTLALLILAVISGVYKEEVNTLFWVLLGIKVLLVGCLLIYGLPRLARWFFRNYEDSIMQFIFVLAMVFLGGGLFEFAGLEGILGAFMVGMILNRLIPHVSPLMNRLEFVGNALFIPYFLIGVGMLIDVRSIFTGGEALKVAMVMTVVATISKWTAAWLTQKTFRMKPEERGIIFGLSNAQAAATLAAVLIGTQIRISPGVYLLSNDVLNGTVVMILFTCIISSLVTEQAARKMVLNKEIARSREESAEEEKILIPIANPETIGFLIHMGLVLKDPRKKEGLIALNVVNGTKHEEEARIEGKKYLEQAAQIAAAADVKLTTVSRFDLNVASGIIHTFKEYNASELLIGLHRKTNFVDSFYGNKTETLLKGLNRQIIIVKSTIPFNLLEKINVAVPAKAEYEIGFPKWVERICRMADQLGCPVRFYATGETTDHLKSYISKKYKVLPVSYTLLTEWEDLLTTGPEEKPDQLLVIITARRGTISYLPLFEQTPSYIRKYFSASSLMVIFPDQLGETEDNISFSDPTGQIETPGYGALGRWLRRLFSKKEDK